MLSFKHKIISEYDGHILIQNMNNQMTLELDYIQCINSNLAIYMNIMYNDNKAVSPLYACVTTNLSLLMNHNEVFS